MNDMQIRGQIASSFNKLRLEAGLSQKALAQKIGCDQAKLSRIESGEHYSPKDIEQYLDGLDTENSLAFKSHLQYKWSNVSMPNFWSPQCKEIRMADGVLEKANTFLKQLEEPSTLRPYVEKNINLLRRAIKYLERIDHKVVFIGTIGVGKSTAISHLFNLLIPIDKNEKVSSNTVLETGAGGTTICEVSIKNAQQCGISIIPFESSEIRQAIADFCRIFWVNNHSKEKHSEKISQSREIERAIRNMADLKKTSNLLEGKRVIHDPIKDIISACSTEEEFLARVTVRINIELRTETEIVFDDAYRLEPKKWIQEKFKKVNNGQISTMSLPKNITIMFPKFNELFVNDNAFTYNITAVDTKGLDEVSCRDDIDKQMKDDRAILVFCSRFEDAPGAATKVLLQHMRDLGISTEMGKASILVLPRNEEALAMKRDDGDEVEDIEEGYELKRDQFLQNTTSNQIEMMFYDKNVDNSKYILEFINKQIDTFRKSSSNAIRDIISSINDAIDNSEEAQYRTAVAEAVRRMLLFFTENKALPDRKRQTSQDVLDYCSAAHASKLWASTRRKGNYSGLNVYYAIMTTIAKDANGRFYEWLLKFKSIQQQLMTDETLVPARQFISRIDADIPSIQEDFRKEAEEYGYIVYHTKLIQAGFWQNCVNEWGLGSGYKERAIKHLQTWFDNNANLERKVDTMLEQLWQKRVISKIFDQLQQDN